LVYLPAFKTVTLATGGFVLLQNSVFIFIFLPFNKTSMKRRSQTQAQQAAPASKNAKEKAGALTVAQLNSDVIWQVGAPLDENT